MFELIGASTVLASGRGRLIGKLLEGDPVAWSIVGGIVAIIVIYFVIKAALSAGTKEEDETPSRDDER